jgi:uncharacterized lipoprotein YddW (UPF0748 family)
LAAVFVMTPLNAAASETTEFRGVWVASVKNINWPKIESAQLQKKHIIDYFDAAVDMNLNAVVVQVRPAADALYKSTINPWSRYLTGTQGQDPGYDPLEFMIEEAHKRNLEFHAWLNPFRVSVDAESDTQWAANSVYKTHPDWVVKHGNQLWLDPGLPKVQQYVIDSILEVVNNYDIDAVHFDDYFYPYPGGVGDFADDWSYNAYGKGKDRAQWRRDNMDSFIHTVQLVIKADDDSVAFGISPNGIWRNKKDDPNGSDTAGMSAYDTLYADTRKWVLKEWVDYFAPQIYWTIGYNAAAYDVLVKYWSDVCKGTNVNLYIGQAVYQIGGSGNWVDAGEMPRQIDLSRGTGIVKGHIFYNIDSLIGNPLGFRDKLTEILYATKTETPDLAMVKK